MFHLNPVRVEYPDGESTTWFDFAQAKIVKDEPAQEMKHDDPH